MLATLSKHKPFSVMTSVIRISAGTRSARRGGLRIMRLDRSRSIA
jgi:hypothetical protein